VEELAFKKALYHKVMEAICAIDPRRTTEHFEAFIGNVLGFASDGMDREKLMRAYKTALADAVVEAVKKGAVQEVSRLVNSKPIDTIVVYATEMSDGFEDCVRQLASVYDESKKVVFDNLYTGVQTTFPAPVPRREVIKGFGDGLMLKLDDVTYLVYDSSQALGTAQRMIELHSTETTAVVVSTNLKYGNLYDACTSDEHTIGWGIPDVEDDLINFEDSDDDLYFHTFPFPKP